MTYLLYTDIVIDYLTGQPAARALLPRLIRDGVTMSVITFSEIYEGIYGSRNPALAEQGFQEFLSHVKVLGVSRSVAKRNALVRMQLRLQKRPISHRALDLLIAATALTHDLTLVTRNTSDFSDIPDLRMRS